MVSGSHSGSRGGLARDGIEGHVAGQELAHRCLPASLGVTSRALEIDGQRAVLGGRLDNLCLVEQGGDEVFLVHLTAIIELEHIIVAHR